MKKNRFIIVIGIIAAVLAVMLSGVLGPTVSPALETDNGGAAIVAAPSGLSTVAETGGQAAILPLLVNKNFEEFILPAPVDTTPAMVLLITLGATLVALAVIHRREPSLFDIIANGLTYSNRTTEGTKMGKGYPRDWISPVAA